LSDHPFRSKAPRLLGRDSSRFIAFGLFMMWKNEDFAHVRTAASFTKGYIFLALLGCLAAASYFWSTS